MKKFTHFLIYNNTIPIALGVLFLGAGATFAASPQARESVVSSESAVVSVDNSYLLNTNIADDTISITINSVTENPDSYYVEYTFNTIGVQDSVWQPIVRIGTITVNKEEIVGRDLGLYVEEELAEVHAAELRLLRETKVSAERSGLTPKVVATEYSGLVGQFFDPSEEVFPGYDPLISPNVGIPLSREQEAAHKEVQRLVEEQKRKEREAEDREEGSEDTDTTEEPPIDDGGDTGGDGDAPPEEEPEVPPEETPADETPVPQPPTEPQPENPTI
jgi:hypothetical protein